MNAASRKCNRKTSQGSPNATSSLEYPDGPSLFDWLDGTTAAPSGLEAVPASRTRRQGSNSATKIPAISGPTSSASSASVALTLCLVNKLKERFGTGGSMEFKQTWKEKVTPSGIAYWAHTAQGHRTSDSDCSGWPTPVVNDSEGSTHCYGGPVRPDGTRLISLKLPGTALLAGWPTPNAIPEGRGGLACNPEAAMRRREQGHQLNLDDAATLAGWATPSATTWGGTPEAHLERKAKAIENGASMGMVVSNLDSQAQLVPCGWATPQVADTAGPRPPRPKLNDHERDMTMPGSYKADLKDMPYLIENSLTGWSTPTVQDSANCAGPSQFLHNSHPLNVQAALTGPTPESSSAETGKPAASPLRLNPFFSAWLMGFPVAWTMCGLRVQASRSRAKSRTASCSSGDSETPSTLTRQRSSSAPTAPQPAPKAA